MANRQKDESPAHLE